MVTHTPSQTAHSADRRLGLLYLVAGLIGLLAAAVLQLEKIALIENPDYVPSCSISPILSCGSVMTTPQAEAFGIPNPFIGIAGFGAIAAVGTAMLAGARFARWFWLLTEAAVTFAIGFMLWLIYQSLYVIGALCPYCMVVWAVTFPLFWFTTVRVMQPLRATGSPALARAVSIATEYRGAILSIMYLTVVVLVAIRFWDYWISLV